MERLGISAHVEFTDFNKLSTKLKCFISIMLHMVSYKLCQIFLDYRKIEGFACGQEPSMGELFSKLYRKEAIKSFYFSLLQAIEACSRDLYCYQVVSWCGAAGFSTCSYNDTIIEHDKCGSALYQKGARHIIHKD